MAARKAPDLAGQALAHCRWHGSGPCSCARAGHALARTGRRGATDLAGQGLAECRWRPGSASCDCQSAAASLARKRHANPFRLPFRQDHRELDDIQFRLLEDVVLAAEAHRKSGMVPTAEEAVTEAMAEVSTGKAAELEDDLERIRSSAIDFMEAQFMSRQNPSEAPQGSIVQAVAFPSDAWTAAEARAWLTAHEYEAPAVERSANYLRYRQRDPKGFVRYVTKTIKSAGRPIRLVLGVVGGARRNPEEPRSAGFVTIRDLADYVRDVRSDVGNVHVEITDDDVSQAMEDVTGRRRYEDISVDEAGDIADAAADIACIAAGLGPAGRVD